MDYKMLVLDLDGTLTNSKKEVTEPTRKALIEIQEAGKIVVLASGRPINGVRPLAKELEFQILGLTFSPVKGPEGNIEFLAHLSLDVVEGICPDTADVVEQAHAALDKGE